MQTPLLKDLNEILPKEIMDLNLIVLMQFGSHLYGTAGPDSDLDFKGIYLPTREQILLNKIPKSVSYKTKKSKEEGVKNTSKDVDCEVYSLHYFLKLAADGQTVALDMLHAPAGWPHISSKIWFLLRMQKKMFYTKSLKAFVGYARRQAAKYGIKGSRLNAAQTVVDFLEQHRPKVKDSKLKYVRLKDVWDDLPRGEHIHDDLVEVKFPDKNLRMYQVCGKSFQETASCGYVWEVLSGFLEEYGERARKAADNEGIDWKAVSHALRAATETLELLTHERITFPLRNAAFIKAVKEGKYDFTTRVQPMLEMYMNACEQAAQLSSLREKAEQKQIDEWLLRILYQEHSEV